METVSVDLGTSGKCVTSRMSGATLPLMTELTAPGVPPIDALGFQFCPEPLPNAAFASSMELPSPSASEYQPQPEEPRWVT